MPVISMILSIALFVSLYLTLVHVSWRLVEVREWSHIGNDTEHVGRCEFLVSGDTRDNFIIHTSDIHIDLFKGAHHISLSITEILDRTHHTSRLGEEIKTRIFTTIRDRYIGNFKVEWNIFFPVDSPYLKTIGHLGSGFGSTPANHPTIQKHCHIIRTSDRMQDSLGYTKSR